MAGHIQRLGLRSPSPRPKPQPAHCLPSWSLHGASWEPHSSHARRQLRPTLLHLEHDLPHRRVALPAGDRGLHPLHAGPNRRGLHPVHRGNPLANRRVALSGPNRRGLHSLPAGPNRRVAHRPVVHPLAASWCSSPWCSSSCWWRPCLLALFIKGAILLGGGITHGNQNGDFEIWQVQIAMF